MYDFGSIVLTRFPFTDLSGGKVRPALVLSRDNARRSDIVIVGKLGDAGASFLQSARPVFYGVFGFAPP